jgi:hypothetical protein
MNWWWILGPICGVGWVALLYWIILVIQTTGQKVGTR